MNWKPRFLRLSLYQDGRLRQIFTEDLAITFSTTEAVSGGLNEANIVIGGIKPETMFYLATSSTQWLQNWVNNKVVIDAGYDNQHGIVFEGVIVEAKPNLTTANYTINLKALSLFEDLLSPKSYSFAEETPLNEVVKKIAGDLGKVFVSDIDDSQTINNFAIRDQSSVNALRSLSQMTGYDIYESKGRIYLKKPNFGINTAKQLEIRSDDIIGIPEPTPTGVNINVRMNPSYQSGTRVKVKSKRYPQLESYNFFIMMMSHAGATKGRDWITHLNLIKEGMGYY